MRQLIPSGLWQVAQLAARLDGALVQSEVAAQRREAITCFESERHAILFTTEAWSHGAGRAGVHLVIHADLGRSVLDFWQRSGRAAREGGERAIVSQLYDARLLAQRARLCAPCKADSVSMHADTLALCRYLATRGCVRQCLLGALGQAQCAVPCGAAGRPRAARAKPAPWWAKNAAPAYGSHADSHWRAGGRSSRRRSCWIWFRYVQIVCNFKKYIWK